MLLVKGICSTKVPPTVADPDLQIRGAQVIQTLRWGGGVQKEFFWPFGPQIGLKKRGGPSPPGTSPRSATAIERGVFAIAMIYHGGNYSAKNFRSDSPIYMDICYLEKMSLLTIVWINADFSHGN